MKKQSPQVIKGNGDPNWIYALSLYGKQCKALPRYELRDDGL